MSLGATNFDSGNKSANIQLLNAGPLLAVSNVTSGQAVTTRKIPAQKVYWEIVPATLVVYPVVGFDGTAGNQATLKTASADFSFTVPSGFSAWDSSAGTFSTTNVGAGVTLSNGNKTAAAAAAGGVAYGSTGHSSGKWYFEINVDARTTASYHNMEIGIGTPPLTSTDMTHSGANCFAEQEDGAIAYNSGVASSTSNIGVWAVNDRVCVAVDLTAGNWWIRRNGGNWNGSGTANPATPLGQSSAAGIVPATTIADAIGFANVSLSTSSGTLLGADANAVGYRGSTGVVALNGSTLSTIQTHTLGDVVQVAADLGMQLVWFNVNNGNWNNNAANSPASGTGGISFSTMTWGELLPAVGLSIGVQATGRFTSGSQSFAAPSGFSALDSATVTTTPAELCSASPTHDGPARQDPVTTTAQRDPWATAAGAWYGISNNTPNTAVKIWSSAATATHVSGFVYENGVGVKKTVRLYDHTDGTFLGETTSAADGSYSIPALGRTNVLAVAFDPTTFNAICWDQVTPV